MTDSTSNRSFASRQKFERTFIAVLRKTKKFSETHVIQEGLFKVYTIFLLNKSALFRPL